MSIVFVILPVAILLGITMRTLFLQTRTSTLIEHLRRSPHDMPRVENVGLG